MKTIFKCILFFILILSSYAQETKEFRILVQGMPSVNTVHFFNEHTGWLAGNHGLLKTEDGGQTWDSFPLEMGRIRQIQFINENTGWATADGINQTVNGGLDWQIKKRIERPSVWIGQMHAVNESTVFVTLDTVIYSSHGIGLKPLSFLRTVNSGSEWTERDLPGDMDNYSIWFFDANRGIMAGSQPSDTAALFMKTADGGLSWEKVTYEEYTGFDNVKFFNDTTGYIIASDTNDIQYLCSTRDGGDNWIVNFRSPIPGGINSCFYYSPTLFFANIRDDTSGWFMKSENAGVTWEKMHPEIISSQIYFYHPDKGFILGIGGRETDDLFKTEDGGLNWQRDILTFPLTEVHFASRDFGLALSGGCPFGGMGHCDPWGDIFITNDGGETWRQGDNPAAYLSDCVFINETTGFLQAGFDIYKTTDGGNNWTKSRMNFPDSNFYYFGRDLYFTADGTGWAVGWAGRGESGSTLLRSSDAGESWMPVWIKERYPLNSVHVAEKNVWAVGERGAIVTWDSTGSFRIVQRNTGMPANDVYFSDKQHGWVACGYHNDQDFQSFLMKTTDGGDSWERIYFDSYLINDMYFSDSLHGWIVGLDTSQTSPLGGEPGILLKTVDGGNNWSVVADDLPVSLDAIHFKDGYGWAVGTGLVLRTEDGLTWAGSNTGEIYPSKYRLFQNYPNPFNPETVISWQLPVSSHVELSIYNILGQKVVTLVNKKQPAGNYQVKWDASGFASGVYLYQLIAGDHKETKKMIFMK